MHLGARRAANTTPTLLEARNASTFLMDKSTIVMSFRAIEGIGILRDICRQPACLVTLKLSWVEQKWGKSYRRIGGFWVRNSFTPAFFLTVVVRRGSPGTRAGGTGTQPRLSDNCTELSRRHGLPARKVSGNRDSDYYETLTQCHVSELAGAAAAAGRR